MIMILYTLVRRFISIARASRDTEYFIDIKPNNILIDRKQTDGTVVEQVQLADLEDSAHVPPDCDIVGKQAGNWMWRSPEAHASGPVNKPSDMFSFGVVVRNPYSSLLFSA